MNRLGRLLLCLALAIGWQLTPPAARSVAAACSTASCATIEVRYYAGTGEGLVTTYPAGIDCLWSAPVQSGTCTSQFDVPGGGLVVTFYLDPGLHSVACWNQVCGPLEQRVTHQITVYPGESKLVQNALFNLGSKTHVSIDSSGGGSGRTTGTPGGLNCVWNGSAESGTCEADVWWVGSSVTVQFTSTPDNAATYVCNVYSVCGQPATALTYSVGTDQSTLHATSRFWVATPMTVTVSGPGSLDSSPSGISCPPTCSKWFMPGTYVHLVATPGAGATLTDWVGDCDATPASANECVIGVGYGGTSAGVRFVGPATPPPAVTPRPTVKPTPRPSATPLASAPPAATNRPTSPTAAPAATVPGSSVPGAAASALPTESVVAADGSAQPSGQSSSEGPGSPPASVGPDSGAAGSIAGPQVSSPDSFLLLLVVVLALGLGLLLGGLAMYALSRRRRAGAMPPRA